MKHLFKYEVLVRNEKEIIRIIFSFHLSHFYDLQRENWNLTDFLSYVQNILIRSNTKNNFPDVDFIKF